ncbi:hypothetical protein JYU34_018298 [Plutella xylostella]|uniref:Uncharacterized protein n=1 Tax=Plutella xylostella TaxID=51655 RepID=A0ABQ7Q086_PLUXY|nr:hypothetical protein JYU34_018298 [Plutella xylostella]
MTSAPVAETSQPPPSPSSAGSSMVSCSAVSCRHERTPCAVHSHRSGELLQLRPKPRGAAWSNTTSR